MVQVRDETTRTRVVLTAGRETPRRPDRTGQTVHRILACNLAALLLLIVAGYVVGARLAEQQALTDATRLTHLVGESVVGPQLTRELVAGDPAAVRALDRVFEEGLVSRTSITRIKVWSADGTVIYSDEHSEIGRQFDLSADELDLLAGDDGSVAAGVSDLSEDENAADRDLGDNLLEVYMRVTLEDGSPGLFEAYLDEDQLRERRDAVFTALALLAGVLVALFAGIQLWLGRLNLRWLRRRQADLDRLAADVTDRERRRVARDLHDGAVQELVGLSFLVDGAAACVRNGDTQRAEATLDRCAESVTSATQSLRSTLVEVYPHSLEDRGVGPALEDLVQPLRSRGTEVTVSVDADDPLPHDLLAATYRAAQETVRNIVRHAQASRASVDLHATTDRLRLTVTDDGVGIDPAVLAERTGASGHLGLRALTDTALELGGRLEVVTGPGAGTEVVWEVPL